jgi:hypothetical protein
MTYLNPIGASCTNVPRPRYAAVDCNNRAPTVRPASFCASAARSASGSMCGGPRSGPVAAARHLVAAGGPGTARARLVSGGGRPGRRRCRTSRSLRREARCC